MRRLSIESLEPRVALSAAGLVHVGAQPEGGLSGKITYVHGGHGYTTYHDDVTLDPEFWSYQRGALLRMVEDLGNQEQMTALADYLFRAGATVVPLRPIGNQPLEKVLDNDDLGVTFTGAWSNGTSSIYYGSAGDVRFKFATTSATETAVARYEPNFAQAGFYPVYAWTPAGSNRAADQLYRVNHAGGSTEVTVNHRRVGNGLVYLGTYYFEAGTAGNVEVSNRSTETGKVAVADMIRFGNGMGSIDAGVGVSGKPREDEAGLYWVQWHVEHAQGISSSAYSSSSVDENATVALAPKYSAFMNQSSDGALKDRVLVSFHSNAAGGRGVTGLHNSGHGGTTPNQVLLARTLAQEINNDLVAQNGKFEHNWYNRGTDVIWEHPDYNFGELNNAHIGGEFDATIIEVAFHDNQLDAELMRDPKVRDAVARATYQGMVRYFRSVDGNATPLTMLPGKVEQVRAETTAPGSATLTWAPPPANAYNGDAPTGYRIYGSTNGYGFDGGTYVAGGGTTTFTMTGLDPAEGAYYFKVVAVNEGGEGASSEVAAVNPKAPAGKKVLIVNGFDRLERSGNPTQTYNGATIERVRPRLNNSFDYAYQVASAIEAGAPSMTVNSTSNEFVISGAVNLSDYDAVFWILGEESTADDTFNAVEQTKVTDYLAQGGKLFLSGAEIGWDLEAQGNGAAFYNSVLKADYVADDAATYNASGVAGSIFSGVSVIFDSSAQFYNVDYPDRIAPLGGATAALNYGTGGAAAIQHTDAVTGAQLVMLAFPFEAITSAATRDTVMARVIDYFAILAPPEPVADFNGDAFVDGADFLAWQRGFGNTNPALADGDANADGAVDAADLAAWQMQFGSSGPAAAETPPAAATVTAAWQSSEKEKSSFALLSSAELNAIAGRRATGDAGSFTRPRDPGSNAIRRRIAEPPRDRISAAIALPPLASGEGSPSSPPEQQAAAADETDAAAAAMAFERWEGVLSRAF